MVLIILNGSFKTVTAVTYNTLDSFMSIHYIIPVFTIFNMMSIEILITEDIPVLQEVVPTSQRSPSRVASQSQSSVLYPQVLSWGHISLGSASVQNPLKIQHKEMFAIL